MKITAKNGERIKTESITIEIEGNIYMFKEEVLNNKTATGRILMMGETELCYLLPYDKGVWVLVND